MGTQRGKIPENRTEIELVNPWASGDLITDNELDPPTEFPGSLIE
jgi:hypothetical protein